LKDRESEGKVGIGWRGWKDKEEIDVPVSVGPEPVPGFLSDVNLHRVRTGDTPSISLFADVRGWQPFDAHPLRFDGRKRYLEVDLLGALPGVLQLSPNREALPDEGF
jgi:hypothetical protein